VAIALAKARAKIPADEDVELVIYPARRTLYEALREQLGTVGGAGLLARMMGRQETRALAAATAPMRLFRRGEPLALMPFSFVR